MLDKMRKISADNIFIQILFFFNASRLHFNRFVKRFVLEHMLSVEKKKSKGKLSKK